MPTLTRWFIKSSMIYLVAALLLSLLLALRGTLPLPAFVSFLNPVFFHLLVVGWVTQMIFGVIYRMFPIITRKNPRGTLWMGWTTYVCLNAGLLLRLVGEPSLGARPDAGFGWLVVLGSLLGGGVWMLVSGQLLEIGAAVAFSLHLWQRIVPRNYQPPQVYHGRERVCDGDTWSDKSGHIWHTLLRQFVIALDFLRPNG
jgi:hypothetical protein